MGGSRFCVQRLSLPISSLVCFLDAQVQARHVLDAQGHMWDELSWWLLGISWNQWRWRYMSWPREWCSKFPEKRSRDMSFLTVVTVKQRCNLSRKLWRVWGWNVAGLNSDEFWCCDNFGWWNGGTTWICVGFATLRMCTVCTNKTYLHARECKARCPDGNLTFHCCKKHIMMSSVPPQPYRDLKLSDPSTVLRLVPPGRRNLQSRMCIMQAWLQSMLRPRRFTCFSFFEIWDMFWQGNKARLWFCRVNLLVTVCETLMIWDINLGMADKKGFHPSPWSFARLRFQWDLLQWVQEWFIPFSQWTVWIDLSGTLSRSNKNDTWVDIFEWFIPKSTSGVFSLLPNQVLKASSIYLGLMVLEAFANSVPRTVPSNSALDVIKCWVNLQCWRPGWCHPTKKLKGGFLHEALHFQAFLGWWSIILRPDGYKL